MDVSHQERVEGEGEEKAGKGSLDDKLIPAGPAQSTVGPTPYLHLLCSPDIHMMIVRRPSPLDSAVLVYHNFWYGAS